MARLIRTDGGDFVEVPKDLEIDREELGDPPAVFSESELREQLVAGYDFAESLFEEFREQLLDEIPKESSDGEYQLRAYQMIDEAPLSERQKEVFGRFVEILVRERAKSYQLYRKEIEYAKNLFQNITPLRLLKIRSLRGQDPSLIAGSFLFFQDVGRLPKGRVELKWDGILSTYVFENIEDINTYYRSRFPGSSDKLEFNAVYMHEYGGYILHQEGDMEHKRHEYRHHFTRTYSEAQGLKEEPNIDLQKFLHNTELNPKGQEVSAQDRRLLRSIARPAFRKFRSELLSFLEQTGTIGAALDIMSHYDFFLSSFSEAEQELLKVDFPEMAQVLESIFDDEITKVRKVLLDIDQWCVANISQDDYAHSRDAEVKELTVILFAFPVRLWARELGKFYRYLQRKEVGNVLRHYGHILDEDVA